MSNAISAEIELGDYIMIFTGDEEGAGVMGRREVGRGGRDRGGERLLEMFVWQMEDSGTCTHANMRVYNSADAYAYTLKQTHSTRARSQ